MNSNFNEYDPDTVHVETPEETAARISRRQLENLAGNFREREQAILQSLGDCRYMTTGQISRLRFEADHANCDASLRAANRTITRLKKLGLVTALGQRIGGVRGGSGGLIWSLTAAGAKLANFDGETPPRRRSFEPSPQFTEHTLAIAELYIQLLGIHGITLAKVEFEPVCWRDFNKDTLKPDLFAITSDGEYEDYWFFEIDLATEALQRIVAKCEQYQSYFLAGEEQNKHGLFPKVMWVVRDGKRRTSIQARIAESREVQHKNLFAVILPDELEATVRKGAGL